MTRQRQAILKTILESSGHLTAEEIFIRCKESGYPVSLATVYRNLGILCESGEIKKVSIVGQPDRFDKILVQHEHVFCERCKELQDINVSDLHHMLEERTGIKILSYDLCLRYICPKCRKKEKEHEQSSVGGDQSADRCG